MSGKRRLPLWLRMERARGENYTLVKQLVENNHLHTICTSGNCPNIGECWNAGTATLMILGDICTRSCQFCGTKSGRPLPPDRDEPERVAQAVRIMGLKHCVITSVDRDDLPDGGAAHWAATVRRIREVNPATTVEALIPDFRGNNTDIDQVIDAGPDVISHNIETVRRLTPRIRSVAKYEVSLGVLRRISGRGKKAKSGLMLGLGESEDEVIEALNDLYATGCRIVTIGQYLAPSLDHMPVVKYVTPQKFEEYRRKGLETGFEFVESSPLVRSSYHAEKHVSMEHGAQSMEHGAWSRGQGAWGKEHGARSMEHGAQSEEQAAGSPRASHPTPRNRVIYDDLGLRDYKETWDYQEQFFKAKVAEKNNPDGIGKRTPDRLIFVEHNHVYTLGKNGSEQNLLLDYIQLKAREASFYRIDRGGDITYHGPGQLVGYPIFDIGAMGIGLREYIHLIEEAIISFVSGFGITAVRLSGATGVWVDADNSARSRKICAIGVRASRYVTMHGFALNVSTDLSYFDHINPCGFTDKGVTSIEKEAGIKVSMDEVKIDLRNKMREVFGYDYY
jgi:lipoic acid synthetase